MLPRPASVACVLLALLFAFGAPRLARAQASDLAGEYRRNATLDDAVSLPFFRGLRLVLSANHTFQAEISGAVATGPHSERYTDLATATGHWTLDHDRLILAPSHTTGKFEASFVQFLVRDCDGQPALLLADEKSTADQSKSPFLFLLLKEHPPPNPAATERATALAQAQRLRAALLAHDSAALHSLIGTIVRCEGDRETLEFDSAQLLLLSDGIHYRIRNNIDGTRLCASWPAGIVHCGVLGTILAIDPESKTVDLQPHQAFLGYAR